MFTPLKMQPCYKEYLWGGRRLKTEYGKAAAPEITAESWELASHPDGASVVAGGEYAGKTIADLGRMDKDGFWGSSCKRQRETISRILGSCMGIPASSIAASCFSVCLVKG